MAIRFTNAFAGDVPLESSQDREWDRWLLVLAPEHGQSMGRFFDFAKRRIVGYIVFWVLALLFLGLFYKGDQPAQAGALLILGLAFLVSLLYTRRMKRRQRARREAEKVAKQMQQAYQTYQIQQAAQMKRAPQAPPAPPAQPVRRTGDR
jgi:hypothetical protein